MSWMRDRGLRPILGLLPLAALLGLLSSPLPTLAATLWAQVSAPSPGQAQSIGAAANGCVGGAVVLPETGAGYVSVRRARNRYFGHPALIRLLQDLGRSADRRGAGLMMVGDLSQPRGGRMPSSHHSHQNGLDADIWFTLAPSPETARRIMDDRPDPPSMVRTGGGSTSANWGPDQRALLESAARHPAVDRIFVNAAIKRTLCQEVAGDRGWLRKLRPWFGHDSHFHLRLRCPADSPGCEPQAAPPPGDGCGADLAWWFSPEALKPLKKKGAPRAEAPPPAACMALLQGP
jgi:penicillin-insensitive murein DD-endopeptidase